MAPTDYARLLSLLCEVGVEFIIVGGVAANLRGSARVTFDPIWCTTVNVKTSDGSSRR